ncbi:right-handed parallel beta-helix repeat-containing protein [Psychroserpens sp. SPM9]|uniref:right-handed parallel beta-helix repeat-containing protein n=1 Tax=Psychroserpens sp. SPM9 TaxID=2975598 RepID=UPI0021A36AD3|nr:right-handed parallel beta-helix repeat-containing protein [Psychroserpens sp. SPM9]MDG5492645.1 right-handed parallel beta-helix repeat-containing protein [Psychroserpens sp. SPM9]
MKSLFLYSIFYFLSLGLNAQQEFHVFPEHHETSPGTSDGNGTLSQPWDLQTALIQKSNVVKSGDTIWLHEGVYNGRFLSKLESLEPNQFITVSGYKNDKVVLNGNVSSTRDAVLEVKGQQVIYKNFDVTWLGDFSRDANDDNFEYATGIRHTTGENCRFYSLNIYNNPGLGIGSWKHGAGTIIENCMIYNNGFMSKVGKGGGEGIYVQNSSDDVRLIKNNIIFNNYYKGIEVWSAGKRATFEFVKNIRLENNLIFNSGTPSGKYRDNVIIASDDRNGINSAKHIWVVNNVFYHNTSKPRGGLIGDAPSLTLGFNKNAPIEDVVIDGNIITGGYNGLRILHAKSLQFTNNLVYTGMVQVSPTISDFFKQWTFNSNTIYTTLKTPMRIIKVEDHSLDTWRDKFQLDKDSQVKEPSTFDINNVLRVINHSQNKNKFTVALFNTEGNDVTVDFSEYKMRPNTAFKMYDAENPKVVLKSGQLFEDAKITFPMQLTDFEKPLHNSKARKTLSNFGVFIVEFEPQENGVDTPEKKSNAIQRFFKWLGF